MRPLPRISDLAALALALTALAGCSTSEPLERYPRGGYSGNQGSAGEVVFAPSGAVSGADWEYARRDDSLNIRTAEESSNPYPDDLSELHFIYLNPRADQVIYYGRPRSQRW